jgi:WD40 repeat protein
MATIGPEPGENVSTKHILSSTSVVVSFHISTNYVIIGLDNASIHIFLGSENKIVNVLQHDRAVWALGVWEDTNTLVAGGSGGELNVWDLTAG